MQGLQQFLAFAQTARRGSFAAAARDLGGSPSTLAKSVARLETGLGVKLFHRTTRQVTPHGRRRAAVPPLRARARRVRGPEGRRLRRARRALRHPAPRPAGVLRPPLRAADPGEAAARASGAGVRGALPRRLRRPGEGRHRPRRARRRAERLVAGGATHRLAGPGAGGEPRLPARPRHARAAGRPGRAPGGGVPHADQRPQPALAAAAGPAHRRAASAARGADQRHRGARRRRRCSAWACASCPTTSSRTSWRAASWSRCCAAHRPPPMPLSAVVPSGRLVPPRVRVLLDALETLRDRAR